MPSCVFWERCFCGQERTPSHCIYRATNPNLIRQHAALARIPCDGLWPVEEAVPAGFAHVYEHYGVPIAAAT